MSYALYRAFHPALAHHKDYPTLETAIEVANRYVALGNAVEVRDDTDAVVWSSSQTDTRWQRLRERVTAEITGLRDDLANEGKLDFQTLIEAYITANETILEWMAELEIEAADGS